MTRKPIVLDLSMADKRQIRIEAARRDQSMSAFCHNILVEWLDENTDSDGGELEPRTD